MSVSYKNYNDYKEQNQDNFSVLQHHVSHGDEPEIHAWFDSHFMGLNDEEKKEQYRHLGRSIINSTYFFAFSSTSSTNGHVQSREVIDEEYKRRHLAVLQHFPVQDQLNLIQHLLLMEKIEIDKDYFTLINREDALKNPEIFQGALAYRIAGHLFFHNQFSMLDFIEDYFSFKPLELSDVSLQVHYRDKNSHGSTWVYSGEPIFKPYSNIIFSYSEEKRNYLTEKGISLPTYDDVNTFKDHFLATKNYIGKEGTHNLFHNINSYQKMMHYEHVSQMIEETYGDSSRLDESGLAKKLKL